MSPCEPSVVSFAPDSSERDLAARAALGEGPAFAELVHRHKDGLFGFVLKLTRNYEDTLDLVQESFAAAWSARARYDPDHPYGPWLRTIALNKFRDRLRRNAVRQRLLVAASPGRLDQVRDPEPSADDVAIREEARRRLDKAIVALPLALRQPLICVSLEQRSYNEASELLGLSVKAVQERVYRARRLLASVLTRADLDDVRAA